MQQRLLHSSHQLRANPSISADHRRSTSTIKPLKLFKYDSRTQSNHSYTFRSSPSINCNQSCILADRVSGLATMASTSRSLFLLSLLVSSFCMTVTASRSLQETNKLLLVDGLDLDLNEILHGKLHDLIDLVFTCDLSELRHPVEILVENAAGVLVKLKVVKGLVTELKEPIEVKVTDAGAVIIVVKALGKKVRVPLKLSVLDPVLKIVGGVLHVVLKLVDGLNVLHIVDPITGEILEIINL